MKKMNIRLADAKIVARIQKDMLHISFIELVIEQDNKVVQSVILSTSDVAELNNKVNNLISATDETVTAKEFIYSFEGLAPEKFSQLTINDEEDARDYLKKYM
jgi:hypothetical protein|nr:MAG TPA: hypothetical protein [Caudoviricetes sp.]